MKAGTLSQYFKIVAAKRLSAVEVDSTRSHQHEFNGSQELKRVFGVETGDKKTFLTTFVWIGEENETLTSSGFVTWYDSRRDHPTRTEYRLYFSSSDVTAMAKPGDMMFIAKRPDDTVMLIITLADSTVENQLIWLFGLPLQTGFSFESQSIEKGDDREIDFAARFILEELNIDVEEPETEFLDRLLLPFRSKFPTTDELSNLARESVAEADPVSNPDLTLILWLNQEEKLFRRIERLEVEKRLRDGFTGLMYDNDAESKIDVDGFISYSLSIQNRRKVRAGLALENHLRYIFRSHNISFSHASFTENRSKPDFIFPSIEHYNNQTVPVSQLTMLGVKTTCKDRWRQILAEAKRINHKHLFTLEPGISENQTNEMSVNNVSLVLPATLHNTYRPSQKNCIMSLSGFINYVAKKQDLNSFSRH